MDWWLVFAVFLYLLCAALFIAEVFVPSGGLITLFALACLAGGVAIFFSRSSTTGWLGVLIAVVLIPTVLILAYRLFPRTRFAKAVTLTPSERCQGDAIPDSDQLKALLGREGLVLTPLRPVGMCDFSGQRVECVAEGEYIEKDKIVKVIRVHSTQVMVRVVQEDL
jgi:membrane-bound serine protease (ClpP class)